MKMTKLFGEVQKRIPRFNEKVTYANISISYSECLGTLTIRMDYRDASGQNKRKSISVEDFE